MMSLEVIKLGTIAVSNSARATSSHDLPCPTAEPTAKIQVPAFAPGAPTTADPEDLMSSISIIR